VPKQNCPLYFPNKRIIIPEEAGLSVLKGAVLFGHTPDYIASRVMRFSYGTDVTTLFDPDKLGRQRNVNCCFSNQNTTIVIDVHWFFFVGSMHFNIYC
jgi:hypothetical protein